MKAWILLSRFENGGLERVQANLVPLFSESGLDTWIVAGSFFEQAKKMLPADIPTLELSPKNKLLFIFNLYQKLHIHQPDIVITTSNDVSCIMLMLRMWFFPKMKVICTQHLSLSAPLNKAKNVQRIKYLLILKAMQWLWPKADAVIAVSSELADDVRNCVKLKMTVHTIHNPIVLPNFQELINQPITWPWPNKEIPTIIFVGRLVKVKRVDLLLEAFSKVQRTQPCRLLIVGDGPERIFIEDFLGKSNLNSVCHLAGQRSNPLPWIKAADVLVLSSDYEGFGNVLVEAMACGTQVVATNCPFGPAEILDNGRYGQLVPTDDIDALAQAIQNAMDSSFHVPTQQLKGRANNFSVESAVQKYLGVINSVKGL